MGTSGANGTTRLPPMGEVIRGATEEVLNLLTAQLKLARLEFAGDLRRALERIVRIALFTPPLIVGYAFAMAALASWLGAYLNRPAALASVAALQIVPAAFGITRALAALRRAPRLDRAGAEIADSVRRTLSAVVGATGSADV